MKTFNKIFITLTAVIIVIFVISNAALSNINTDTSGRMYRVEISRIVNEIKQGRSTDSIDLSDYQYVTAITIKADDDNEFFNCNSDYTVRKIGGKLYRFDYNAGTADKAPIFAVMNIFLAIMAIMTIGVMIYIKIKILSPFRKLSDVPYQLSKGNLTHPLKENKSRYFGRFIWGVDLLRENIEQQKTREMELQKDKKTLLLSLSHDIKTPLSAIKLYSKALSKGLYSDKEKQIEIADSINAKADEIESYISQIVTASREDFLSFEVNNGEFYLSELIDEISSYYDEKMEIHSIDFSVNKFSDCILKGDKDRSNEVLQNIIENAIKYGDGKTIDISFSDEENCRLISVKNSGSILSENELIHIFDSFQRGSNASGKPGSGLGLYISKKLMNLMGGEIFSECKNGYMTVTLVFNKA